MDISDYIIFDKNCSYIRVKVVPKSVQNEFFSVMEDGTFKIRIKAVAEKWKANKELLSFLSEQTWYRKNNIEIISWASSQVKIIRIKL